jgi:hypothetical protein
MKWSKLAAIVGGLTVAAPVNAFADAIDGHWCFPDGKRISIQGPHVVTMSGNAIQGDYSRHFISYVIPRAEPDAGLVVSMTLLNEDTVRLSVGAAPTWTYDGAGEIWHRCGPPTS